MLLQMAIFHSFLSLGNIPVCVCVCVCVCDLLKSIIWAFGLLPCLGYYKQCYCEHWSTYILLI